jgi:hypothetical protein
MAGGVRVEPRVRLSWPNSLSLRLIGFIWITLVFKAAVWARRIENSEDICEWPEKVFGVYPEPVAPIREIP